MVCWLQYSIDEQAEQVYKVQVDLWTPLRHQVDPCPVAEAHPKARDSARLRTETNVLSGRYGRNKKVKQFE